MRIRGLVAGLAGTTVMTATLTAEQRLRRNAPGPVDYDASPHVVTAASAVLHWHPSSAAGRQALFLLVHWGYGSAVGIGYDLLRSRVSDRRVATALFYAGCQAMAMTLFPTLGGTPPPWRWRRDILLSSVAQHAIYALTVASVSESWAALTPRAARRRARRRSLASAPR